MTSADGRAVLRVPAGALAAAVPLSLSASFATNDPFAASPPYVIAPAGTRFAVPAELTIAAIPGEGPLGPEPSEFQVHVSEGGAWRPAPSADGGGTYKLRWTAPPGPCTAPEDRQFDFWLGNWSYVVNGLVVAPNVITRDDGGCIIHEHYANGAGASISFRGRDGAWYQTYVSGTSTPIKMRGGLEGRRMILYGAAGGGVRFVWDPVTPDRVRYVVESSSDGGATWTETAPNEYVRR